MNELRISKYKDFILSFFAGMNVDQGLSFRTILSEAEKDYDRNRSEMNNLNVVLDLLLSNDYLHVSNSFQNFIMLSQKGYDHINGDFPLELSISLGDLMYLREIEQKGKDFIFNELWKFIGKEEEAFFYVNGPDYYNIIKPFIQGAYPSYSEYIGYRQKKGVSTSRIVWYRELFSLLADEDVEIFISKLSEKINTSTNNKEGSNVCVDTTLFDNVEKISRPQEEKGELRVIPMIVFISYAWDENKEEVQRIAKHLKDANIEVRIDEDVPYGADLVRFMNREIRDCTKCLVFLTPKYKEKAELLTGGVAQEGRVISRAIYQDQDTTKFIPILLSGTFEECCPDFLIGRKGFDFVKHPFDEEINRLIRALT
jgi:SEFIR domain-containing protein